MNKKNKINWVSYLMHNFRITGLIIILLFVFGIFGFDKMAKFEAETGAEKAPELDI